MLPEPSVHNRVVAQEHVLTMVHVKPYAIISCEPEAIVFQHGFGVLIAGPILNHTLAPQQLSKPPGITLTLSCTHMALWSQVQARDRDFR